MNETILVIEDDKNVSEVLRYSLEKENYRVLIAENGKSGYEQAARTAPSLILLDVILPGMNGWEVCDRLKADPALRDIPVIMLTEKSTVEDRVRGLDTGADDYVPKPFSPRELMARVRARLRDHRTQPDEKLQYAGVSIDIPRREVEYEGKQVELTAKEFDLLVCLVHSAGRVLTRDAILHQVWGYSYFGTTRTVDVHVNHLRQKIPPLADLIATMKPLGYKLRKES
jgi:two-component system alkaline phosphatase synthesis response regulator PhoP